MRKKERSLTNQNLFGVGLRPTHFPLFDSDFQHKLDWFEAISENFIDTEGRPFQILNKVRESHPLALHGVSLSIGADGELNFDYLKKLKSLVEKIDPVVVSDHLCWTGSDSLNLHDLLPVVFTEENLKLIVRKLDQVQTFLGRQILLENVSSYITFKQSEISEWDFISTVAKKSGCGILLDLNNVYVSAINHSFDPMLYVRSVSSQSVGQIHLAGYSDMGDYLFDTHSKPVYPAVWDLYREFLKFRTDVPVILEWDEDIPDFETLQTEALKAKAIWAG